MSGCHTYQCQDDTLNLKEEPKRGTDHLSCASEQKTNISSYQETYYRNTEESIQQLSEQNESDITFEAFWEMYPVKKNREKARVTWFSNRCYKDVHEILTKLQEQKEKDRQFLEGYAPHPTTYLNDKRWLDEIVAKETKPHIAQAVDVNSTDWAKNFDKDMF